MHRLALSLLCLLTSFVSGAFASPFLVENGQPGAEIVISETPLRSVRLAAQELQDTVKRINGAHLPIVTSPTPGKVKLLVGRSPHTDTLGISAKGLKDGAYRLVSGEDWLVLLGEDTEFTPIAPWAKNNAEIVSGKTQAEWDKITGALWGLPHRTLYKNRFTVPGETGLTEVQRQVVGKIVPLEMWSFDERGSYNAVCGFLMRLGVRWYMPGEVGEVLPDLKSIPLPKIDETVRPDFPVRRVNLRFGVHGEVLARWAMRLGVRDPYGIQVAHGLDDMTHRKEILKLHPEWFALYGGKRHNQPEQRLNQLCYSNTELFDETVRYVRAQLDHYQLEAISVMPPDGYTAICQCPLCEGKDSPERDQRGLLSDHIWDFVNRVAKEVGKTHPDKKILNCAYGVYTLPPLKIKKLEPNVVVSIVGGRRPMNNLPEQQAEMQKLRESWLEKTSNPLINFENYPFTDRGWYLPAYTPQSMGESINAIKGDFQGEDIWLTIRQDFEKIGMGYNHFLVYFTQRMYWGGKEEDVIAMFREYVNLCYGPAAPEMLAFFDYCESHWQEMEKNKAIADEALALFEKAKGKVDAATLPGKRLALIDDFLKGLRSKSAQLGKTRGPVPVLRLVGQGRGPIVIDGKLDEEAWVNAFPSATVTLRELQTGRPAVFGTTVKSTWIGNNLYLAFRCEEAPGEKPVIGTTKEDDAALWYGDCIEVLLETNARTYYQIAVAPDGTVADLDRSAGRESWFSWDSQVEVATHLADDHWIVEMRLPITEDENDPLHQIIGRKPTKSLPWYLNLCRQRLREDGQELSAFSPTGTDNFHREMKFAHLYDGNSFTFEADDAEDDFLNAIRLAADLARTGKRAEALAAYTAAADRSGITDFQKSHALELAATTARGLREDALAATLTARIPIEAVKKSAEMQNLLATFQAPQVIAQFAQENIAAWPFWKRGDGFFARGRAYSLLKAGKEAESDLATALQWTGDPRSREGISLALAQNRETQLGDEAGALTAYEAVLGDARVIGGSDRFAALHGIARLQTRRGQFDEALATLRRVDPAKHQGTWRSQFLVWQAETLSAAGRIEEAIKTYETVIADPGGEKRFQKLAAEKLALLKAAP